MSIIGNIVGEFLVRVKIANRNCVDEFYSAGEVWRITVKLRP